MGPTEILIIVVVVAVLFFGGKKLPELARGLGQSTKAFKDGLKEEDKPADK